MLRSSIFIGCVLTLALGCAHDPRLSEGGPPAGPPPDKPVTAYGDPQLQKMQTAIAPFTQKARTTWPGAKARYLAGLPEGTVLFATVQLHDSAGKMEQVFVKVVEVRANTISGRIWNDIGIVKGFEKGQEHSFPESELIDWTIVSPDGTEEGNVVGKFLDTWDGRVP
jgi:uncharacterized protein YegJ (DUF2314 family)